MKKSLFVLGIAVSAFMFTSCGGDDDDGGSSEPCFTCNNAEDIPVTHCYNSSTGEVTTTYTQNGVEVEFTTSIGDQTWDEYVALNGCD